VASPNGTFAVCGKAGVGTHATASTMAEANAHIDPAPTKSNRRRSGLFSSRALIAPVYASATQTFTVQIV
jgi:hypothetical protein